MLLGLVRPPPAPPLIGGRPYPSLPHPRRTVGAVLETTGAHPGRRAQDHLRILIAAKFAVYTAVGAVRGLMLAVMAARSTCPTVTCGAPLPGGVACNAAFAATGVCLGALIRQLGPLPSLPPSPGLRSSKG
jgi:hypothetical protein